ncbi:MAG TPA: DUF1501 domain-containing protein [Fluviicola sp.]|nr:DUF1501 domain-containing protein [Fluviicola sp.]
MKRRNFIQSVALSSVGAPLLLKDFKFGAITKELFKVSRDAEDRVLILIRLNGGNDGLSTLVPLDQYDNLVIQRPDILIPENQLITLNPTNAFHPVMTGMANMFNDGKLSIIQNVGYPEQNRSHFRSMDIWSTGLMDPAGTTGWLGRHLDNNYPNFPDDYPNASYPDPFAISMGYEVSSTCQGLMANFSTTVVDPFDAFNLQESSQLNDGTYYGSHMEYLATMIAQANDYGAAVNAAANNGSTLSTMYDDNNPLAVQLRYVAQMISGGLQTKIYIVNINGFDTHDSQVADPGTPHLGDHANLLKSVSDAVAAFQDDLNLLNLEQRVAGMTFSEFGRQIAANASLGTDHGDAAPLFLFGTCISSQIIGPNPVIGDQIVDQAGIPMQIDFRDVYASVLKDWFQADPADIQAMFEHTVNFIPVLDSCNLGIKENKLADDVVVFPNPCGEQTTIRMNSKNEEVTIQVRDMFNRLVVDVCSKSFSEGSHDIPVNLGDIPSGEYLVTVMKPSGNFTKRIVKVKHI